MLPPKSPGQRPSNAASPSGATATRPSIGRSGIVAVLLALPGRSTVPVIALAVEPPHVAAAREGVVQERGARVRNQRSEATALGRDRGVAVRTHLQDLDHERVARLGAFDRDRPHLARPLAARLLVPLAPERLALQDVAGLHGQHRLAHGERRIAHARAQTVRLGARRPRPKQDAGRERERRERAGRGDETDAHQDLQGLRASGFY